MAGSSRRIRVAAETANARDTLGDWHFGAGAAAANVMYGGL